MAECRTMPHSAELDCRVPRAPSRVRFAGLRPPLTAPTGRSSAPPPTQISKEAFFSTPTTGSQIASIVQYLWSNPQLTKMKSLKAEDYLADLLRQWLAASFKFPSYCAYEKRPTKGVSLVVNMDSAVALCTKAVDPIDADHIEIVKPTSQNSASYIAFKAAYADVKTIVEAPDVTPKFVFVESPGLVLVNRSDKIAREIRWAVVLWNIDDPKVYSNPTAPEMQNNHEPLPIPASTVDFIRPHSETGPLNLFGSPIIRSNVKVGDRLIGSASVICPDCARGYTLIVYIVFRQGGWYYNDLNNTSGDVVIPRRLTRQNVISYFNELTQRIAEKDRIPITDPF